MSDLRFGKVSGVWGSLSPSVYLRRFCPTPFWWIFSHHLPFLLFVFTSCQIHLNPFKRWRPKITIISTFPRGWSHYLHYLTENRQGPSQSRSSCNSNWSIWKQPTRKYVFIYESQKFLMANIFLVSGGMLSKKQGGIRLQSRWKADTLCIMNLKLHIHISSNIEHNQYDQFNQQIMYKCFITDWEWKMYMLYIYLDYNES